MFPWLLQRVGEWKGCGGVGGGTSQMRSPQLEWVTAPRALISPRITSGGKQVGGWGARCIVAQGRSCGWKTQRFSPPCNYNLIMHMEASIRSHIGPLPGYTAPGAGEPTQDRNNLISPGLTDEREQRRNSGLRNEQGVTADGAQATPINKGKSRHTLMMSF